MIRRRGHLEKASWDEALSLIAAKISEAKPSGKLAAFGGNPLTVEENYLFQKLMRDVAGVNHVDHRIGTPALSLEEEGIAPGMEISIGECEKLSYIVLLGLDITEEFPVIWLRLKQAINHGAKVICLGHFAPEVAKYFTKVVLHAPGKELEAIKEQIPQIAEFASKGRGALFVGRQYLFSKQRREIVDSLLKLRQETPDLSLNLLEGRGNSVGARIAGMRPDFGPLGERMIKSGLTAPQVLAEASSNGWDFLYVAGSDPAVKFPSKVWNAARSKLGFLIVQDLFLTQTARQADVLLPTLSYVEKGGSFINIEGRVQTLMPGKEIPNGIYSDAEIFKKIAQKLNYPIAIETNFLEALKLVEVRLARTDKQEPIKAVDPAPVQNGSLAATFAPALFDQGVRMKHNPHTFALAKEPFVRLHPFEGAKRGIQNGDSVSLTANGSTIDAKAKLDMRVSQGTVVIPLGFDRIKAHELDLTLWNGMPVAIQREVRN